MLEWVRHPFAVVPSGRRRWLFIPLIVLTVGVWTALTLEGSSLETAAAPNGIVSFELAGDPVVAGAILKSWDQLNQMKAVFNLGLDFLFLVLYSTTLALACMWAADQIDVRWAAGLGAMIAWLQWLAALLDATENTALLVFLFGVRGSFWPALARTCALWKFGFVGLGLAYILLGVAANRASALFRKFELKPGEARK